jgi:hypothetical protein
MAGSLHLESGGFEMKEIMYKLEAQSKGRNGFFRTSGVILGKWNFLGNHDLHG